MHRCALFCAFAAVLAGPALADEKCRGEVAAAFNKQRGSRVFAMTTELKTPSGMVEIKAEYQPPDRMRQTVTAPGQDVLETVLYGQRAYSRQGTKWEELMPAVAQTIIAQVRAATIDPPKEVGDFDCQGTTTLDGKEYLAYRSVEKQADAGAATGAPQLHRTIYIDPKTGLPALNVVAGDGPNAETIFKATYDYPEKIEIEDHPDAPLVKMR
jgi:hypothetical protein